MIDNTCFIEVNSILARMDLIESSKIPKDVLYTIRKKANNKIIEIDSKQMLEKQISKEALSILTYIILKYVANNEQRGQLKSSLTQNQLQYEKQQLPVKDLNDIFKNKEPIKQLCIIENDSFIKKIIKKIMMFFKRKA